MNERRTKKTVSSAKARWRRTVSSLVDTATMPDLTKHSGCAFRAPLFF